MEKITKIQIQTRLQKIRDKYHISTNNLILMQQNNLRQFEKKINQLLWEIEEEK